MSNSPDWNSLIQQYASAGAGDFIHRRLELWVYGYIPQAQYLAGRLHQRSRILDFGCGNGKISRYLSARHGFEMTGVDISPEAIRLARSHDDGISYHLIEPDRIPANVAEFDAAVSSHVFCTFDQFDMITSSLAAIRTRLKKNGIVCVYVDNTRFTGVRYSSFQGGESGVRYASGDRFPMRIFGESGELMSFDDFYWAPEDYVRALFEAGFSDVGTIVPEASADALREYEAWFGVDVSGASLSNERSFPPAALYVGHNK